MAFPWTRKRITAPRLTVRSRRDYCTWCYLDGSFTGEESLDAFIEHSAPYMAKAAGISEDEAVSYLAVVLPTLGRWADPEGRAHQGVR